MDEFARSTEEWARGWRMAEDGRPFDAAMTPDEMDGWCEYMREIDKAVDEAQYTPRPGFDY